MKVLLVIFAVLLAAQGLRAQGAGDPAIDALKRHFSESQDRFEVVSVEPSVMEGLYQVEFSNGDIIFSSADGRHFIAGDLYRIDAGRFFNLSEQRRDTLRGQRIAAVPDSEVIVFPASGETRATLAVFTDTTCFYCQKLHREVPQLNAMGIEVRYFAFPREGVGSAAYNSMVSAWCAEDPPQALTALKNRQNIPSASCDNPVAEQYRLGQQIGVQGTPAMVTADGVMLSGYQPAADLARALGVEVTRPEPQPPASIARPPES